MAATANGDVGWAVETAKEEKANGRKVAEMLLVTFDLTIAQLLSEADY